MESITKLLEIDYRIFNWPIGPEGIKCHYPKKKNFLQFVYSKCDEDCGIVPEINTIIVYKNN